MLASTDPTGYMGACAAVGDANLCPLVSAIQVPSLIIAGALDESTPPSQSEELHRAIRGSKLVVLHAAHLSNLEQPEAFNTGVLRFLGEHEPDQTGS